MKIDKEFLNKIYYNGDLNKKQLDILNIDFSSEKNYENEALGQEISKNDSNLLMLLRGIDDLKSQEQIVSNYHLVLEHNNIKANVYKNEDNNISTSNNILKIYCDGACSGNPGNAGSGIAIYFDDKNPVLLYGDFIESGTNNIAELNALYKAYTDVTGDTENKPMVIGGGTYAKKMPNCVAFGCEFPGKNHHMHEENELISLDDLLTAAAIYAQSLYNLLKK